MGLGHYKRFEFKSSKLNGNQIIFFCLTKTHILRVECKCRKWSLSSGQYRRDFGNHQMVFVCQFVSNHRFYWICRRKWRMIDIWRNTSVIYGYLADTLNWHDFWSAVILICCHENSSHTFRPKLLKKISHTSFRNSFFWTRLRELQTWKNNIAIQKKNHKKWVHLSWTFPLSNHSMELIPHSAYVIKNRNLRDWIFIWMG